MAEAQAQIFAPPRLLGDPELDIVALSEWTFQFYRAVIIEGGLATPGSVDDAVQAGVDPASATAATAQETANTALALAQADKVRLDRLEAGEFTIADAATTALVTFAHAQADTNYYVAYGVKAIVGAPAIDATLVIDTAKTVNGFTVTVNAAPTAGKSVTLFWQVQRND